MVPSGLSHISTEYKASVTEIEWEIPDKSVDLDSVNVVELLKSSLDLTLVGLDVHDKDKCVVLLNLLHGALGVERVHNDLVVVEAGLVGDGLARVFGRSGELQSFGEVECGRGTDLAQLLGLFFLS